jgi:hypothetical protein
MKNILTLFLITFSIIGSAQNFHFEPTNELSKTISLNGLSDLKIDIIRNNTVDTLYLKYELITNTLPDEWYQGYCDNHGCWGSLPESGVMSPCFDEINSYITLSIDPTGYDGSGTVEYFVYETDHYEDGLLMTFHIDTPGFVGTEEMDNTIIQIYPNPAMDYIQITSGSAIDKIRIYSLTGQLVNELNQIENNENINISNLEEGIYLMEVLQRDGLVFTQKLKKM